MEFNSVHDLDDLRAYSIKEFSELTGVPQQTLRYWERELGEAFIVPRDAQDQRFYQKKHFRWVEKIQKWRDEKSIQLPLIKDLLLELQVTESEGDFLGSSSDSVDLAVKTRGGYTALQHAQYSEFTKGIEERLKLVVGHIETLLTEHTQKQSQYIKSELDNLRDEMRLGQSQSVEQFGQVLQESILSGDNNLRDQISRSVNEQITTTQESLAKKLDDNRRNNFRIRSLLRKEAIETWNAKPLTERTIKTGLFSKVENEAAKSEFIQNYIDLHFEERVRKDIEG